MAKNSIERILEIDRLIRESAYPSRRRIAERFEVSIKTVERDLAFMRDRLLAPIEFDRDRCGFYYADGGFFLPALFLDEREASALFLSQRLGAGRSDTPLAEESETAWRKLERFLPEDARIDRVSFGRHVTMIDRSVALRTQDWLTLFEGATVRRAVQIEYRAPGRAASVTRTIHPYRLVHHRDVWYCIAFDEYRDAVRTFSLARVHASRLTPHRFQIPNGFDPLSDVDATFGLMPHTEWFTVRVVGRASVTDVMAEQLSRCEVRQESRDDGKVELSFTTNQFEEVRSLMLQLGENIEVIQPKSLRTALAAVGRFYRAAYEDE